MIFIWFNPDMDTYQSGTMDEFDLLQTITAYPDKLKIFYEFSNTPESTIDEIVYTLNGIKKDVPELVVYG